MLPKICLNNFLKLFVIHSFITELPNDLQRSYEVQNIIERAIHSSKAICHEIRSLMKKSESGNECAACSQTFTCPSNVRAHVESKHYSPGYYCPICGGKFKIRNTFVAHLKGHLNKPELTISWLQYQK